MKTLHRYLTRQVLLTLGMTVLVFTFVLLLGQILKEVLALLVSGQASLLLVAKAVGLLLPYVLVFALPMGMLAATLLVFGRFSADQELTAVRAGGISLVSLISPILILSVLLTFLCTYINLELAPRWRMQYKELLTQVVLQQSTDFIAEDRFIKDIPGYVLYVRKKEGNILRDVSFYKVATNQINYRVQAKEAEIRIDAAARLMTIEFTHAIVESSREVLEKLPAEEGEIMDVIGLDQRSGVVIPLAPPPEQAEKEPGPHPIPPPPEPERTRRIEWVPVFLGWVSEPVPLPELGESRRKPKIGWMTFSQLRQEIRELRSQGVDPTPALVQLHRLAAFSFSTLAFTLIGIPLGIRAHRRETTAGIAMALVLVLIYYAFIIFGQSLDNRPQYHPYLIPWLPNFLFQGAGAILLWRANRTG
jgi:lipopolysaccharide export system permease protein